MKKLLFLTLLTLILSACAPAVMAKPNSNADLTEARHATVRYHNLDTALAEGFEPLFDECISHAEQGAMGFHYIHPARVDGTLHLAEPEVLMYEQQADGQMKFIAVEYIVFEDDWSGSEPPQFLGQTLQRKTAVGHHEVPAFYEVHVWLWKPNPAGMFADWNPNVSCG
jgi:hypothetical protein